MPTSSSIPRHGLHAMLTGAQQQQGFRQEVGSAQARLGSLRPGVTSGHHTHHPHAFGIIRSGSLGLPRPDHAGFSEGSTERDVRAAAHSAIPPAKGLFDPANDKDACGVGFVAQLSKVSSL